MKLKQRNRARFPESMSNQRSAHLVKNLVQLKREAGDSELWQRVVCG